MKTFLCIYNPRAGGGKAGRQVNQLRALFEQYHLQVDLQRTDYPEHAARIIAAANLSEYAGLLVAGGDGSFYSALNAYMALENRPALPFGILPAGSGNSLSRDLIDGGAPMEDFVKLIAQGRTRAMDIARVQSKTETFYFANMMGFGFIADVNITAAKLKDLRSHAYTLGVLYRTIPLKTMRLKMTVDGKLMEMENVFVIISNSKYTGGDYLIAPKAKFDDGKLDLIILNKLSRFNLLKTFPKIFDGSHIHTPYVDYLQASEINLEADRPVRLSPDGEVFGEFPATVSCVPGAVEVFCG